MPRGCGAGGFPIVRGGAAAIDGVAEGVGVATTVVVTGAVTVVVAGGGTVGIEVGSAIVLAVVAVGVDASECDHNDAATIAAPIATNPRTMSAMRAAPICGGATGLTCIGSVEMRWGVARSNEVVCPIGGRFSGIVSFTGATTTTGAGSDTEVDGIVGRSTLGGVGITI